jgi:GAF domain-containing protein
MPPPTDDLTGRLLSISAGLAGDANLFETLTRLCELAVEAVPGCEFAGITLLRNGEPTTAAFTDSASPEIDSAQYASGAGPCLAAFRDGIPYAIDDTRTDRRWPEFAAAADAHGIRSTLSMPLAVSGTGIGALNMYATEVEAFGPDDADTTALFAGQAAAVLANAQSYWAAQELSVQLQEALESRAVIDQAKGMLMAEHRCSADDAFAMLRAESQRANRKLREVAQSLVEARIAPD